jgi:hypothetical protein
MTLSESINLDFGGLCLTDKCQNEIHLTKANLGLAYQI